MKTLDVVAAVLLVIGGVNWGLVGLFQFDLVRVLTADAAPLPAVIYTLVGVAATYQVVALRSIQRRWNVSPRLAMAKA